MRKCNLHAIHRQDFCTVIVPHEPTALCEDAVQVCALDLHAPTSPTGAAHMSA